MKVQLPFDAVDSELHTASSYDLIATRYAEVWFDRVAVELASRFLAHLPLRARILDAGCGPGHYTQYFESIGYPVLGIDISSRALAIATMRCERGTFQQMSFGNIAFPAKTFDGIWACASIVHVPIRRMPNVLLELHRILRPGGILFINIALGSDSRIETPEEFNQNGLTGRFFQRYPNGDNFSGFLVRCGFELIDRWAEVVNSEVLEKTAASKASWMNFLARKPLLPLRIRGAPLR